MDKPVKDILSVVEIKVAIETLSDSNWIRLNKAAKYFSKIYNVEFQELLNESFTRALSGQRKCPKNVPVALFLANAMKSIGSKQALSPPKTDALHHVDHDVELSNDTTHPINISSPEKELIASKLLNDVVKLFEGDDEAQMLIMCEQDNMSTSEIQDTLDIDSTRYASIKKRIRRRYNKLSKEVD